jgi:hypothetical protein
LTKGLTASIVEHHTSWGNSLPNGDALAVSSALVNRHSQ